MSTWYNQCSWCVSARLCSTSYLACIVCPGSQEAGWVPHTLEDMGRYFTGSAGITILRWAAQIIDTAAAQKCIPPKEVQSQNLEETVF